jgi:hypothetical protein
MFTLIAEVVSQSWSGEVARETFATLEDAERQMSRWARFGIDGYCTDVDLLRIVDGTATEIRRWNWRRRKPVAPEPVRRTA